jgi:hypothetical protein
MKTKQMKTKQMKTKLTFLLSLTFLFLVTTSCAKSDANIYGGLLGQRLV